MSEVWQICCSVSNPCPKHEGEQHQEVTQADREGD